MLIFSGLFILIIIGIIFFNIQIRKGRLNIFSASSFLTLILTIITPGIIASYFLIGLSCIDGCYVKKYSPKWFFTMNLSEIGSLPITEPVNEVQYYYDTDLEERWEIEYESKSDIILIQNEIENYLKVNQVKPNPKTSCYNGHWDVNDETIILRYESKNSCIMIYLDSRESDVLVRALEINKNK